MLLQPLDKRPGQLVGLDDAKGDAEDQECQWLDQEEAAGLESTQGRSDKKMPESKCESGESSAVNVAVRRAKNVPTSLQ